MAAFYHEHYTNVCLLDDFSPSPVLPATANGAPVAALGQAQVDDISPIPFFRVF